MGKLNYDLDSFIKNGGELGKNIYLNKYQYIDDDGNKESFEEFINRVCGESDDKLKQIILDKKFLFGGRILANRGLDKKGKKITLSNCYVCEPVEDNIENIYETCGRMARTFSYGGGVGLDISKLAPDGAKVNNAAKKSSGAVSFMDTFSQVPATIGNHGRRGALMLSIDCNHPDLEEFIKAKANTDHVNKANISVRVDDNFMKAVVFNKNIELSFVRETTNECISKTVNARDIFLKIAEINWEYAEPGILFWDKIKNYNMLANNKDFEFAGVNPCAEQPLPAGGSCLLGAINLSEFVDNPFTDKASFNFTEFRNTINSAVYALNDVLDEGMSLHPLPEQRESVKNWRQIGLGIMGLADMLIKMGIKYGSEESLILCDKIGFRMAYYSIDTSIELAVRFGEYDKCDNDSIVSTEFFDYNIIKKGYNRLVDDVKIYGMRNSQLLTIAPTGSISNLIGVSGGIEPIFDISYTRKTESIHEEGEKEYKVYTPIVKEYMDKFNITDEKDLPDYFVTAKEIPYRERIDMQAVWQKHIDASISSTINMPNETTVDDVFKAYLYAWENGLKGLTIYRDGCGRSPVLTTSKTNKKDELPKEILKRGDIISIGNKNTIGLKRKLSTGCGSLHLTAIFDRDNGNCVEVFCDKGSTGGCNNFMIGLSRLVSIALRGGVSIEDTVDQLMSTGVCPSFNARKIKFNDTSKGSCCPMAIGYALLEMQKEIKPIIDTLQDKCTKEIPEPIVKINKCIEQRVCPDCGEPLLAVNGCYECHACGYTKCNV